MLGRSVVHGLVMLGALLVAPAAEGTPAPRATHEPTLLAYQAFGGGILTIRPDGTGHREILSDGDSPAWSPDGARLLYVTSPAGILGEGGLWTVKPDGTDARLVIRPEDIDSGAVEQPYAVGAGAWSPSGRRVAFVATHEDAMERGVQTIWTAATDGTRLRKLRRGGNPEWLPGGRRIAFTIPGPRDRLFSRIATMRSDGRGLRVLLGDMKRYRSGLDVSPDGRRLAFVETRRVNVLRLLDLRTRRTRTIPSSQLGPVADVEWIPGRGKRLAVLVSSPRHDAPSAVYSIRPDGTGKKLLFTVPLEERRGGFWSWAETISWQPPHH